MTRATRKTDRYAHMQKAERERRRAERRSAKLAVKQAPRAPEPGAR